MSTVFKLNEKSTINKEEEEIDLSAFDVEQEDFVHNPTEELDNTEEIKKESNVNSKKEVIEEPEIEVEEKQSMKEALKKRFSVEQVDNILSNSLGLVSDVACNGIDVVEEASCDAVDLVATASKSILRTTCKLSKGAVKIVTLGYSKQNPKATSTKSIN